MIKRIIGIITSISIHLIVFLLLMRHFPLLNVNTTKAQSKTGEVEVTFIPSNQSDITVFNSKSGKFSASIDQEICKDKDKNYIGIGLTYASSKVISVPIFYPAYKAGIRVDDVFLDFKDTKDGYVEVIVKREFDVLKFRIKTEKICYKDN